MNISFIVILFIVAAAIYILENMLKIGSKKLPLLVWRLQYTLVLMLSEALLIQFQWIYDVPHLYLITFPLWFQVPFLLSYIFLKKAVVRGIPKYIKSGPYIVSVIVYLTLLPYLGVGEATKQQMIQAPPHIIDLLIWMLNVLNLAIFSVTLQMVPGNLGG